MAVTLTPAQSLSGSGRNFSSCQSRFKSPSIGLVIPACNLTGRRFSAAGARLQSTSLGRWQHADMPCGMSLSVSALGQTRCMCTWAASPPCRQQGVVSSFQHSSNSANDASGRPRVSSDSPVASGALSRCQSSLDWSFGCRHFDMVNRNGQHTRRDTRVRAIILEPGDGDAEDFAKRLETSWVIRKQPIPAACERCCAEGSTECPWCAGTGFFILGDNMLCEVPSRNTTCLICQGHGTIKCEDCKGTGFRARWLGTPKTERQDGNSMRRGG